MLKVIQHTSCKSFVVLLFVAIWSVFFCYPVLASPQNHTTTSTESQDALVKEIDNLPVIENHEESHHEQTELNPSEIILSHVLDGYSFHFFEYGGHAFTIDLPVILYAQGRGFSVFSSVKFHHGTLAYDGYKLVGNEIVAVDEVGVIDDSVNVINISITRNVAQMLLGCILLLLVSFYSVQAYKKVNDTDSNALKTPKGMQNAIEALVVFVRDDIALPNLKERTYKYLPFLLSIFFFILINNLLGLLPGSANVTGNIAFTLILSVLAFLLMLMNSNKAFWLHLAWPPGIPFLVKFILVPVEFLGIFVKPFALMIRLFANMLAGHIIIICFVITIFVLSGLSDVAGWGFSPVSVAFMVFIYAIEILVAFIQAYIFTTLTAVFVGQMMEHGAHETEATH